MLIKVIDFEGEKYAIVREQNEWTGNYIVSFRKVRGDYGEEFVRHNGTQIDVRIEAQAERVKDEETRDALKFYKEYRGRV